MNIIIRHIILTIALSWPCGLYAVTGEATTGNVIVDTRVAVLTLQTAANGQIASEESTYLLGTNATLTATPSTGYVFSGWSGNASGTSNPLTLLMNGNKTVGAAFAQDSRDPDGDGLTNYQELIDHSTNPNNADSNADGLRDGLALALGKNPNEDHSAFVATLLAERAQLGLRTDSDYTDLRAGTMSIQRAAGSNKLQIRMKLQKSTNLLNWQDDGEAAFEMPMDPASPKLFYRFGVR